MLFRSWEVTADPAPDVATVTDQVGAAHILVTRHSLVRRVLADPHTFRPDNALDALTPVPASALRVLARHGFRLPPTLANNGGADHPAIRAVVAEALHPRRVADQRAWLDAVVSRRVATLADRLAAGEAVDLYAELTADLPLLVLARLVELPAAPVGEVREFARAALELFWAPLDADRQRVLAEVVGRFHTVLRAFAATGTGLAGRLRTAAGDDPDLVVSALFFLLVAGQET
ncbi:MAG TPA: cytochrome P450, partial [Catenuloplanes sp.]